VHHAVASALLVVTLAACDASPVPDAPPHEVRLDDAPRVDLRFEPIPWEPGESIVVEAPSARMRSAFTGERHIVGLSSNGPTALEVAGVLDGEVVWKEPTDGEAAAPGGATEDGPTSIHRATVCRGGRCTEVIEYDYDLTEPSAQGTTQWTSPRGHVATVDRVRFVLASPHRAGTGPTAVRSPRTLDVVE
jgi:hypothetical protein